MSSQSLYISNIMFTINGFNTPFSNLININCPINSNKNIILIPSDFYKNYYMHIGMQVAFVRLSYKHILKFLFTVTYFLKNVNFLVRYGATCRVTFFELT